MKILKLRKVKIVEPQNWKDITDLLGLPTVMLTQLLSDNPIEIGDRVTLDVRVLVEKNARTKWPRFDGRPSVMGYAITWGYYDYCQI